MSRIVPNDKSWIDARPGDFLWLIAVEEHPLNSDGPPLLDVYYETLRQGEDPTHIRIMLPTWKTVWSLPISRSGEPNKWSWNGRLNSPSLAELIFDSDSHYGTWRGRLVDGKLVEE